jgi:hypothetical protein
VDYRAGHAPCPRVVLARTEMRTSIVSTTYRRLILMIPVVYERREGATLEMFHPYPGFGQLSLPPADAGNPGTKRSVERPQITQHTVLLNTWSTFIINLLHVISVVMDSSLLTEQSWSATPHITCAPLKTRACLGASTWPRKNDRISLCGCCVIAGSMLFMSSKAIKELLKKSGGSREAGAEA